MSDAMIADFVARADALSVEEILSVISNLTEKLKRRFSAEKRTVGEKPKVSKEREAINALRSLSDSMHLTSNERSWTREELYER